MKYITWEEMNKHLDYCYQYRIVSEGEWEVGKTGQFEAKYIDKLIYFILTYRIGSKVCSFQCRKDSQGITQMINGVDAYSTLQRYYKCPDLRDIDKYREELKYHEQLGKFLLTARPLLYRNEKYNRTRNFAYGYDVNSSYSYAMLKDLPDTTVISRAGIVEDGEIGFFCDDENNLYPVFTGKPAYWIFPLMKSPFKRFVDVWYNNKAKAKTQEEKVKAKGMLNYCIGYMQRTNPFIRATIVYYANKKIKDLISSDTLYCNTDSIVSLKKLDIELGTDIGEFKLEHEGQFAFVDFNYQWDFEIPSYRSVSKAWFYEGFDILKNEVPGCGNVVEFKNYKLRRINYEVEKSKKEKDIV